MRAFVPLAATLLIAAAAGCASPNTPDQTGNAGGTGNTTGAGGSGGTSTVVMCGPQTPPAPAGGANYPFPQHRLSQSCGYPTNCNDADVRTSWDTYKARHIVSASPGLRVQRPSDNNDTVSEGMAYGMLLAVYMNDKLTFDSLWQHAQARRNSRGLLRWHYDGNGSPIGSGADNAATDADEDAAFALIMADKQWGGYVAAANTHLASMMTHMIADDNTLQPDDVNTGDVNPSYFAPAYYRVFAQASADRAGRVLVQRSARQELPRPCGDVLQRGRAERNQRRLQPGRNPARHVRVFRVRRAGGQRGHGGQRRLCRLHAPDLRPGVVGDEDRHVERVQLLQCVGRPAVAHADDGQHGQFPCSLTACVEY
jgi:hypothetical protein